jgi:DNA adenine methylase
MDYYSPLRYPGGKAKVADFFKTVVKDNILYDAVYVEPYAGGAAVGLALLFNEYVSKIIINDIDPSIYAFWHSVLNHSEKFCELISKKTLTVKTWRAQREIQRHRNKHSRLELGFSTFFLNRTNRSGILDGGVIGGLDQTGPWKIDARYNKEALIERVRRVASFKDRIELHNLDAVKLIKSLRSKLPKKTLLYFDPPYYVKGQDLYQNFYGPEDHKQIADAIETLKDQKWIVTYDNVPEIRRLYSSHRKVRFNLNYSAAKASKGQEVMVFSDNLYISKRPVIAAA